MWGWIVFVGNRCADFVRPRDHCCAAIASVMFEASSVVWLWLCVLRYTLLAGQFIHVKLCFLRWHCNVLKASCAAGFPARHDTFVLKELKIKVKKGDHGLPHDVIEYPNSPRDLPFFESAYEDEKSSLEQLCPWERPTGRQRHIADCSKVRMVLRTWACKVGS